MSNLKVTGDLNVSGTTNTLKTLQILNHDVSANGAITLDITMSNNVLPYSIWKQYQFLYIKGTRGSDSSAISSIYYIPNDLSLNTSAGGTSTSPKYVLSASGPVNNYLIGIQFTLTTVSYEKGTGNITASAILKDGSMVINEMYLFGIQ